MEGNNKCKKCGNNDWYVRGKYKRCIPCHTNNQKRTGAARKAGISYQRTHKYEPRPLSQSLNIISQRQLKTYCSRGHEYTQENTRIEISNTGLIKRRCIKCIYLKSVRKYGNEVKSTAAEMLSSNDRPWERINEL